MASIYWYCLLAIIGVGIAAFTIYKKRDIKLSTFLVFFIFSTCVTWIGEFVVLGLLDGYAYKTGIYTSPWAQNILGHLILNSTFYPGTAILVAAYSLGYGWISLITAIYLLIEYLFMNLGIYEHHWWKYYMTGVAIFIYQLFTKVWFKKLDKIPHGWLRTSTFYFVGFVILHYPIPIILLLGKQHYNVNWAQDMYLSSTMFIFLYQLVETLILVFFVCVLEKWYWKFVPFIISFVGQSLLVKLNILVFQDGWNLFYTMLVYFFGLSIFILLERYSLQTEETIN
ncbi:hypothetical protein E4K67_20040 [Desulfosporosinus fructosivorans]|uniref:Uncharacterized protein n=1 Tax=Desulfosporosinus fructosivorans TaxID=2018669 RepID=A0A4Z0QZM7_9FIRM|nr:hypothetical protein [Desulfosporosinus fructosivorans]TGE36242.1 hypothetical protein E4K67_20040 [Desulfosporosinus fructosivorans]